MACYHPLKAFIVGYNKITGKSVLEVKPYSTEFVMHNGKIIFDYKEIPCGQCIGCRLEYSRQWANRLMLELQYHESAYFVTLTYSNDYVPRRPVSDPETGEYKTDSVSLEKKHVQTFMKHLRKHFPDQKIRFFCAGEYGSKTMRPHYHMILFGLKLDDLKVYKRNPQGDILYTSKSVSDCWSNFIGYDSKGVARYDPVGFVIVAPVTWETCAYTARYVTKKMSGPLGQWFIDQNMELPFSLMSRKPGIAYQWYKDHPDCMDYDSISIKTEKGGKKFRPPRYFERLYEIDDEAMSWLRGKEKEYVQKVKKDALLQTLDKSYIDYLADKEFLHLKKTKILARDKI